MSKFNTKEVKCNGIGGSGYQGALKHKDQILAIVEEVRNSIGLEAIWKQILENDPIGDYHQGRRFLTADDNVSRLITGLGNYTHSYLNSDELVEMHLGAILNNLTFEEKVILVVDACRDCAGADHWYTFEKEWD